MNYWDEPLLRLVAALLVGGTIGLERAYRGRAAGFRTHILVCLASSLLMILMDFQWQAGMENGSSVIRMDPARMAQGIMTGIGFLGAGVIMQDKQSVRGLTTAASIWITAAIGIVLGSGYYLIGVAAAVLTLITLAVFNRLIDLLPMRHYAFLMLRFRRGEHWSERQVRDLLSQCDTVVSSVAFKLDKQGANLSYQMTVRTTDLSRFNLLAEQLLTLEIVSEFDLRPLGD